MILINPDPSSETRRNHICYYVTHDGSNFHLYEVVEVFYQHPDGPCELPRLENHRIKTVSANPFMADSNILLLYHQQMAMARRLAEYG